MNAHDTFRLALGLLFAALAGPAVALDSTGFSEPFRAADQSQPENITFDPKSGNYILTYEAQDELRPRGMYQTIYVPPNKINPTVKSMFKSIPGERFAYRYTLKSGKDSQQNIEMFSVLATSATGATISTLGFGYRPPGQADAAQHALALTADARKVAVGTPAGWDGYVGPAHGRTGLSIGWTWKDSTSSLSGLPPGKSQGGFGYTSEDLPGIGLAGIRGGVPTLAFAGDGLSQKLGDDFNEIRQKTSGVTRPVAVPTFFITKPFNAAKLLEYLQAHAKVDLVKFKLIDPALVAQLDPWFTAAIDAAKGGNTVAARYQIKELRRLLKQEHQDVDREDENDEIDDRDEKKPGTRIDKLAARVLDFDLKYIDKRLGHE